MEPVDRQVRPNAARPFGSACRNTRNRNLCTTPLQELPKAAIFSDLDALPATLLASALFVVSTNRYRLQRRFDQTECDTQVMQPVLDFLFHGAPFRVVPSG
jgi:hypothetical protein